MWRLDHVKAAARGEAWGESTNPFARHNRAGFKKTSLQTRAEEGRSLYKTQTAPSPRRPEFDELNQAHPQHLPQTTTNARSRRIDEFFTSGEKAGFTTSPRDSQDLGTLRDPRAHPDEMQSDSTDHTLTQNMPAAHEKSTTGFQPSTNAPNEDKKRHGLKGLFHKKDKSSDNNNNNNDHNNGKDKSEAQHFTFWSQIKATIFGSWINVLLIFCKSIATALRQSADSSLSTDRYRRPFCQNQPDRGFCHQLYCHHPTRSNAELRNRGNRSEDW